MVSKKPVFNDEQLDLKIARIGDIYHQLSLDLFDSMIERLTVRGAEDLKKAPYIWQLHRLNDMHMLNEHNLDLIAERSKIAKELIRDVIENEGLKVYKDTKEQLLEDLGTDGVGNHYNVQEALQAYCDQTFLEVDNLINTTLPMSVRSSYEKIITQTVAEVVTGIKTPERALNDTIMQWFDRGFYGFTDRGGKRWTAEAYARTIIKTTSYRVYREMRTKPADEVGIDTFLYSMKSSAREMCAPLQNQVVTKGEARTENGVRVLSLLDYGYGEAGGCQGINCGHYMTPFIPGINKVPELPDYLKGVTPEQAIKNANAEAKQRAFERQIRKNQERLHVARQLNDKELIRKLDLKDKKLKGSLNQFIKNHSFLHRDKTRERYIER